MNSIYVATNLAEDLIVKTCGIFVCRLCRSCSLFSLWTNCQTPIICKVETGR